MVLAWTAVLAVLTADGWSQPSDDKPTSRFLSELRSKGVEPTRDGLRRFLREMHPNQQQRRRAEELVHRLGSNSFTEREQAMQQLLLIPALPVDELQNAAQSGDPEISWRAKAVLRLGKSQFSQTLYAALGYIAEQGFQGVTDELFRAVPLCDKHHQMTAIRNAIRASAVPSEASLIAGYLDSGQLQTRVLAVYALGYVAGSEYQGTFRQIVASPEEPELIKFEATFALANGGHRSSLDALLSLMNSSDIQIRVRASQLLRRLTNRSFGFAAYDKQTKRDAVIEKWREWLAGEGQQVQWELPIDSASRRRSYLYGNTLLAFGYQNRVAEFDASGKELWSFPAEGAWMAEKMPNGNVIIAAYSANAVLEVSPDGKEVARIPFNSVLSARPLENGNLLVGSHSGKVVKEIQRDGKVVWEFSTSGSCCDAHRLPSGNTLICSGNTVVEVTPDKKEVWSYTGNQIYGIEPLESGNVLVCQLSGSVVEVSREANGAGKVVWEYKCNNPVDAYRLDNGNTLITGGNEFLEVTPDQQVVWRKPGCNYGSARR